eukprot:TRINITY_DN6344_c0_g1_i1.p1 TRINITY_DN6344_c0_g1~~TRINITY_DN6344_c0_g1_i1.p1  ORF type:complete len:265 (+),score=61.30 TRINITY_DN6344_c0_g1_i1:51-845(+)
MFASSDIFLPALSELCKQIVSQFDMTEQYGPPNESGDLSPYLVIESGNASITEIHGRCRVFNSVIHGRLIDFQVLASDLSWSIQMLVFLTDWDSGVPHFYVDCVYANPVAGMEDPRGSFTEASYYQLTVDLLPKVDLITRLKEVVRTHKHLDQMVAEIYASDVAQPIQLPPRQAACMSPWHIAIQVTADQDGIALGSQLIKSMLSQWLSQIPSDQALLRGATEEETRSVDKSPQEKSILQDIPSRDRRLRSNFFHSGKTSFLNG